MKEADGIRRRKTPPCFSIASRPSYIGSAAFFLGNPVLIENFRDLAGCVRKGGTMNAEGTLKPEHPIWVEFARSMAPIAAMDAELVARLVGADTCEEMQSA